MEQNWTLEDFYAGDRVCVEFNSNTDDTGALRRLIQDTAVGLHRYYWGVGKDYHFCDFCPALPSAPLSYFISLLDAAENTTHKAIAKEPFNLADLNDRRMEVQNKQTEPEYIYEPFSEEAAKSGAVVVLQKSKKVVEFKFFHGKSAWIIVEGNVCAYNPNTLRIRRTIETKEVECYVYEDGSISSYSRLSSCGKIIETFTHKIKIPKAL